MDIDQQGDVIEQDSSGGQILLPSEAHPGIIHVLPNERPFFPGQAIPLVVDARTWLPTLKSVQKQEQDVIGLIATRGPLHEVPGPDDLFEMGTICRIHRVHREEDQLQILLEGLQRFRVRRWVSEKPPFSVAAQYFPER
jgi:ATP-dependent Lon protease